MWHVIANWFKTYESLAIWAEGIALVAIFFLDWREYRKQGADRDEQHRESATQMAIMQSQADALVNSERAWVVVELIPQAVRASDNQWYRYIGAEAVRMSTEEIIAGDHLRYKLRLTNMGRTPAQIFDFTISYSCLGKGVTELATNAGGTQTSYRAFEQLLGGNGKAAEIEEPIVDVGLYMRDDADAIRKFDKTAVIHGSVKYRHMFSDTDDCFADYCYVFTASTERLTSVGRHTKQRKVSRDEKSSGLNQAGIP